MNAGSHGRDAGEHGYNHSRAALPREVEIAWAAGLFDCSARCAKRVRTGYGVTTACTGNFRIRTDLARRRLGHIDRLTQLLEPHV